MQVRVVPQTWTVKRPRWCDRCQTSAGYLLEKIRIDWSGLTTLSSVPRCKRCDDHEEG